LKGIAVDYDEKAHRLAMREAELKRREAQLAKSTDEAIAYQSILLAWPIVLKALNRRKILSLQELNDIRFAQRRYEEGGPTLARQIERALEPDLSDRDAKKKRLDGT
jgi:hypothetical protein